MGDFNYMVEQNRYLADKIGDELAGGVIQGAILSEDGESVGLNVVQKAQGRGNYNVIQVWIDADPEGNGPGFLTWDL